LRTALTVAVSLAQIGEFSFILSQLGVDLGLLSKEGMSLILAASLIAIAINPLLFAAIPALQRWLLDRYELARRLDQREAPFTQLPVNTDRKFLEGQVVLVGYGRIGQRIATSLVEHGIPFVIAEQNRECVERLRKHGIAAVCGDAADAAVLIQAHIAKAAMLVIATPLPLDVHKMTETARTLNPGIEIVVRTHDDEEKQSLRDEGFSAVFFGDEELALSMSRHVVKRFLPGVQTGEQHLAMAET
jgi:CPA2 family monovalent cation:H+ antiporter-2